MAKIMMFAATIALLARNILLVQASPLAAATAILTRVGPITPGGPNVTLIGTAEIIYHQILELNPSYNPEEHGGVALPDRKINMSARSAAAIDVSVAPAKRALDQLEKRTPTSGCCRCLGAPYNGDIQGIGAIVTGRDYLNSLGNAACGTDGGGVSRVSCSQNSAIYLVNSVQASISAPCSYLATLVQNVLVSCTYWPIPLDGQTDWESMFAAWASAWVSGQMCDSAGFCVVVSTASC